jgi:tungstate transport system substrate-binding protein
MNRFAILVLVVLALCGASGCTAAISQVSAPATQPAVVRCAVIGGLMETNFWPAVAERFEKQAGIRVEVVASGPKEELDKAFRRGGIDLVVMHSSDTMINLVADGVAADPQPWLRNDMILVGPPDDPAGIKGHPNALAAFKKIAETRSPFVVHSSLGAQEVLRAIMDEGDISLDPEKTTILFDDRQRRVLGVAAEKKAYTLVGRIPFLNGKIPNGGLVVMVRGDARLRRPYLVAVADPTRVSGARAAAARQLAAFLRRPDTQEWIGGFGKGMLDDQPIFHPVQVGLPATQSTAR